MLLKWHRFSCWMLYLLFLTVGTGVVFCCRNIFSVDGSSQHSDAASQAVQACSHFYFHYCGWQSCKRGNLGPLYLLGDTPNKMCGCGSPSLSWLEVSPIEGITPLNLWTHLQAMARYARREVSCLSSTGWLPFLLFFYFFSNVFLMCTILISCG